MAFCVLRYVNISLSTFNLKRLFEYLPCLLSGIKKNKYYSRETRTEALKKKLDKFKYRTHLIDSFNKFQYKYGYIMQYTYTYNPLENSKNDRTYKQRYIDEMIRIYKRRL